jgi:hypothetical protein
VSLNNISWWVRRLRRESFEGLRKGWGLSSLPLQANIHDEFILIEESIDIDVTTPRFNSGFEECPFR